MFIFVEDVCDRLFVFYVYVGLEDVGWDLRWNSKFVNGGNEIEGVLKFV